MLGAASILSSPMLLLLASTRSPNITRRQQIQVSISLRCVRDATVSANTDAADSHAVLDPSGKGSHFARYWTLALQKDALKEAEKIVHTIGTCSLTLLTNNMQYKECYFEIYGDASTVPLAKKKEETKLKVLLCQLSDDEEDGPTTHSVLINPAKPWLAGFQLYLDTQDHLNGMSTVAWWGVSGHSLLVHSTATEIRLR